MCGVVDGGIVAGPLGLRGRAERRRRHLRLVRRARRAAGVRRGGRRARARVHEHLTELAAAAGVGEHGLVALDWHSGNRSVLVDHELSGAGRRADPGHPRRGHLPGAARGHRVRHPHHRRDVRRRRRAGHRARRRRRPAEEPAADADLRRRDRPAAVDHRLRAGPGARLGDPRRGRRRRLPRRPRRRRRRWAGRARGVYLPIPAQRRRRTTRCSPSTRCCTTTSAAAATT